MKKSNSGDSLVGIIIGVFILAVALIGIINVLGFSKNTLLTYNESVNKYIIESNVENITKKLPNDIVTDNNTFYLYKDTTNKEFKYLTGAINEDYKYISKIGENVDPNTNIGRTYKVELKKKIDILKHVIYPPEIDNIVFHFDATNIDGSNNSTLSDGSPISLWKDLTGNGNDAYQSDGSQQPIYKTNIIGTYPNIDFDGSNDTFQIDQNILINDDGDGYYNRDYKEKTLAIVLKTGFNITDDQVIFEQGGRATGYNFMIHNGHIYAGIHNTAKSGRYSATDSSYHYPRDSGHELKSVDLGIVYPDTIYFITIVQDSTHYLDDGTTEDDVNNKLKIYLNGELVSYTDHVDPQAEHYYIGMGSVNGRSVRPRDGSTIEDGDGQGGCYSDCLFYQGTIGEFIEWNHALTNNEIRGIQNYFKEKWLGATSNIKYHRVESDVKKVN